MSCLGCVFSCRLEEFVHENRDDWRFVVGNKYESCVSSRFVSVDHCSCEIVLKAKPGFVVRKTQK
jgi:hypothetical protein